MVAPARSNLSGAEKARGHAECLLCQAYSLPTEEESGEAGNLLENRVVPEPPGTMGFIG
jgi:hypothetical protein